MSREALEAWADALEFDDIPQGFGALVEMNEIDPERDGGMCGLGVACKVYADLHGTDVISVIGTRDLAAVACYLPGNVADWLGIDHDVQREIVNMNDIEEVSLPGIGSWVRDHLLKEE